MPTSSERDEAVPSTQRTGSCASLRAVRPSPHAPACTHPRCPQAGCAPAVSSSARGALGASACSCTSVRAASRATSASRTAHPLSAATAAATTDHADVPSTLATSERGARELTRTTRSAPPRRSASSTSTIAAAASPPAIGRSSTPRHSVTYRWRCDGDAAARSARDLKPSSSACGATPAAPSRTVTASALSRDAAAHNRPAAESRSSARSTENGSRVSPVLTPLDASAHTHSASSRSAGCTTVPCCDERTRRAAAAASSAFPNARSSVRYAGPY